MVIGLHEGTLTSRKPLSSVLPASCQFAASVMQWQLDSLLAFCCKQPSSFHSEFFAQ